MISLSVVPTRNRHAPTAVARVDGRELYLHSRIDPIEEADFIADGVARQERTLYVLLGCGLGYHVRALLERIPASSHVVVVEPADARLSERLGAGPRTGRHRWLADPRLGFLAHHLPQLTPTHLASEITSRSLLSVVTVPHVPSMQLTPAFFGALVRDMAAALPANIDRQLNTLDHMVESDLRNFWANLATGWSESRAAALRGHWAGRPLVIVGGGPSLDHALPLLPAVRDRILLLATGSTVRLLLARGIRPDLVVSVDPYDPNLAHFVGWDGTGIPLVYYHRFHRGIPRVYAGPMFGFEMMDEPPLPLVDGIEPSTFRRGGTVSFSALQLAHLLEANPILFVGQDFAFAEGRTHAAGAIYGHAVDEAALPAGHVRLPGVHGAPVVSNELMHTYLLHMQDYLLHYRTVRPGVRHINTSTTGAVILGTERMDLLEALDGAPSVRPPAADVMAALASGHRPVPAVRQRAQLDAWIEELQPLVGRAAEMESFPELFQAFAATALFDVPGRGYRDLWYVFEAKYKSGTHPATAAFVSRFKSHLAQVLDDLRSARGTS